VSTTPAPARAVSDFGAIGRILSRVVGRKVEIEDRPGAREGVVDAKDRYIETKAGQTKKALLGVKRLNDATIRFHAVRAARDLAASGAEFSGGHDTDRVNKKLWTMGYGGKIQVRKFLKPGILGSPAAAMRDIFEHGNKYAFECATAMMVIYHKAILDMVGDDVFDAMFTDPSYLKFFRWDEKDADYLACERMEDGKNFELVPGSHYYYRNPNASDPAFGGENVLYLGKNDNGEHEFYGHGLIGSSDEYIVTEKEMMDSLTALQTTHEKPPFREKFRYHIDGHALMKRAGALS